MEFRETIRRRCSTRKFSEIQITEDELKSILEAAMMAPLALGDNKTSHLTVVRDKDLVNELREVCLLRRKDGTPVDPFYGAPTIIFFSAEDLSDDHIEYSNAGCVIENMCLAAADLGLGSCYIWGCLRKLRNHPETMAKLNLPVGYSVLSAFVCGYPAEDILPRECTERISCDIIG